MTSHALRLSAPAPSLPAWLQALVAASVRPRPPRLDRMALSEHLMRDLGLLDGRPTPHGP